MFGLEVDHLLLVLLELLHGFPDPLGLLLHLHVPPLLSRLLQEDAPLSPRLLLTVQLLLEVKVEGFPGFLRGSGQEDDRLLGLGRPHHVALVAAALGALLSLHRLELRVHPVEVVQLQVVLSPHVVAPGLVAGLLLLRQLLVLVGADLGHVRHAELWVVLLDLLPPLGVVQHVHRERLLRHLGVTVVVLRLVEVSPGLGQPGPGVGNHLRQDAEPSDPGLDVLPVLLAVLRGELFELDLLPVQLTGSAMQCMR